MFNPLRREGAPEDSQGILKQQGGLSPSRLDKGARHDNAFTLIEMLVVILIIGILAAILLPTLAAAKKKAQLTYCINNLHEFFLGIRLYADDFDNTFIPFVNGGTTYQAGGYYEIPSLAGNNDFAGVSISDVTQNCQEALTECLLYPYLKNTSVFVCPGDTRITRATGGGGFAYCTYSKTQNFAGDPNSDDNYWGMGDTCRKDSDVATPSATFTIVEDTDWRGFNDGTWVINWDPPSSFTWQDPLAMYHGDINAWAFVDGHVGTHKWSDPVIIAKGLVAAQGQEVEGYAAATTGADYSYVQNGLRFPGWEPQ